MSFLSRVVFFWAVSSIWNIWVRFLSGLLGFPNEGPMRFPRGDVKVHGSQYKVLRKNPSHWYWSHRPAVPHLGPNPRLPVPIWLAICLSFVAIAVFTSCLQHGHVEANGLELTVVVLGTFRSQIFLIPLNHLNHPNCLNHPNHRNRPNHPNYPNRGLRYHFFWYNTDTRQV